MRSSNGFPNGVWEFVVLTVGLLLIVPPVGVLWVLFVVLFLIAAGLRALLRPRGPKPGSKPYTPEQIAKLAEVRLMEETRRIVEEAALTLEPNA